MIGTSNIFLGTFFLATLNLFSEDITNLVSLPWLHISIEDQVDLLKRPALSLGVHEEHMNSHDAAEDSEDNISLPLDVVEGRGNEVRQGEVENPVGRGRDTNTLGSVLQRENLRCVDPSGRSLFLSVRNSGYSMKGRSHTQVRP